MHSGATAARAQISREFSRSGKLAGRRSGECAVLRQGPLELWVCVLRVKRADNAEKIVDAEKFPDYQIPKKPAGANRRRRLSSKSHNIGAQ
jgi:hypothetical protein